MNDLLFAVPWWIPTLLAVLGIALFLNGNKTQVVKLRNAGLGVLALAIVWGLVSYLVDTDKEKVEKGTRQLLQTVVDGTANGDWSKFKSQLMPTVLLRMGGGSISGTDQVTTVANNGAELIKLKSAVVQNLVIEQSGPLITVHCDVFSTQDFYAPVETSSWEFDWEQTQAGWKVRELHLLKIRDLGEDQMDGVGKVIGNKR